MKLIVLPRLRIKRNYDERYYVDAEDGSSNHECRCKTSNKKRIFQRKSISQMKILK